ncbi:MAG: hypothetical protein K2N75_00335, partial [Helicobacter sp.]|uniref:hypothetical protein n=1 Tax=Helicobacter sp. TaxID=218 RepID=UPI0023BC2CD2
MWVVCSGVGALCGFFVGFSGSLWIMWGSAPLRIFLVLARLPTSSLRASAKQSIMPNLAFKIPLQRLLFAKL